MNNVDPNEYTLGFVDYFMIFLLLAPILFGFLYFAFYVFEVIYHRNTKKPLVVYGNIIFRKLSDNERISLERNSVFYKRLKPKYKRYFEHRVVKFIERREFLERDIIITQEMKIQIAAVYVQLTFGMRNYQNPLIEKIVIYPNAYLSTHTNEYYKGEFNPALKTIVFSWADFKEGVSITNDNLNLGLHEFTHALHFLTLNSQKTTYVLFKESLYNLFNSFKEEKLGHELFNSGVLRQYAFKNQFEFVAVLLEHFFESPQDLKQKFPSIYVKVKEMLNYNEKIFIS